MLLRRVAVVSMVLLGGWARAQQKVTPSETHRFRVHASVTYRCYAGYDGKVVLDERTKQRCDNKTVTRMLVDEVVSLTIVDEPDPDDSPALVGAWSRDVVFQGRKFTTALTLFTVAPEGYRARAVAHDDEPSSRATAVFLQAKRVEAMNPLTVVVNSVGKKEELSFTVTISPEPPAH